VIERKIQGGEHGARHPLAGLWLVRKSVALDGVDHFGSIVDKSSSRPPNKSIKALIADKHFDGNYITERRRVEMWLRNDGKRKGVNVGKGRPLYFRLNPQPHTTSEEGKLFFNFPAESVPPHLMTCTLDDSFHNLAVLMKRPHPAILSTLQPDVLTAQEVADVIANGFPEEYDGHDSKRYIECQVWSRELEVFERAKRLVSTLGPRLQDKG
jgi:hypothetical protein